MKLRAAALLLLLLACGKQAPAPAANEPEPLPTTDDAERASLINMGHGTVVVSRTGEALLDTSALSVADGDPLTYWLTPPLDPQQSIVVELPARSRIERIGIRSDLKNPYAPHVVTFDSSLDGKTFTPLGKVVFDGKTDVAWTNVTPAEAAFVRATIIDAVSSLHVVRLESILAGGRELEPPHPPRIDGSWTINGRTATFASTAGRITGAMQYAHNVMRLDGGVGDRVVRMQWIRGPEYGFALFTGDGEHLSGVEWHEEPIALFLGDAFYGARAAADVPQATGDEVAQAFLERTGQTSLFALRFHDDGSLDTAASAPGLQQLSRLLARIPKARLVAREFRRQNAQENRAFAQRELDAIRRQLTPDELARVTFVAAGSENLKRIPGSEAARELYSTVDLEVAR